MKFYDYDDNNVLQTVAETTIIWDSANEPTNYKWSQILYDIRRADANQNLFLEPITEKEILDYYADQILTFDALVVQNNQLEKEMKIFERLMNNVGENLKVSAMQQTTPFTKNGVANVCNIFELSDGQTITIFFHSPDTTPKKITPTDNLISYKWVLNKKDITIVVAPERGKDLNVREVCRRIMKLAEKNSAAFARANKNRAEKAQKLADTENEIAQLEKQLADLQQQLEIAKVKRDEKELELVEVEKNIKNNVTNVNNIVETPTIPITDFNNNIENNKKQLNSTFLKYTPLSKGGLEVKNHLDSISNGVKNLTKQNNFIYSRYMCIMDDFHNKFYNYLAEHPEGQVVYEKIKNENNKEDATKIFNSVYENYAREFAKSLVDNIKQNGKPDTPLSLKEVKKLDDLNEILSSLLLKADAGNKNPNTIFKDGFIDAPAESIQQNKENIFNILKSAGIEDLDNSAWNPKANKSPQQQDWQLLIDNLNKNIDNIKDQNAKNLFKKQLKLVLMGREDITTPPKNTNKQNDINFKRNLLIRANILAGNSLNTTGVLSEDDKKKIVDVAGILSQDGNAYAQNINYASENNIQAYLKNCGVTNMTDAEIYALNMYGTSSYKSINQQFREGQDKDPIQNAFSQIITSALDKLPNFDATEKPTYRGVGFNDEAEFIHFCFNFKDTIEIKELMSTSYDKYVPFGYIKNSDCKVMITVYSKSGRYISPFHSATRNKEILYKPNTKFKVESKEIYKNRTAEIILREVDNK